jgi:transcriptional regulator with XRE-family HTH domain
MGRRVVADSDRMHGERLGRLIAERREHLERSAPEVAHDSRVSIDAVRSLENGRVPTPSFLTIAKLADVLELSLDELHARASRSDSDADGASR